MTPEEAMSSAARRLTIIPRDKRDDPWIVLIDGERRTIKDRATWATIGAAKGAMHRFLRTIRLHGGLAIRATRDERAAWIADHCKFKRLSQWRAAGEVRR